MAKFSFSVLKSRSFFALFVARLVSTLGLQAQAIVVGWQIYSLTGDPFLLGLTGLAEAIPAIVMGLFAGYIVDKSSSKRVYQITTLSSLLNTLMLGLVAGGVIPLSKHWTLAVIFVGVFLSGVIRSFTRPASSAMLQQIVGRAQIGAAVAWQTSGFQAATVTGPAIAGLVYGVYGVETAWGLLVTLAILSLVFTIPIKVPAKVKVGDGVRESAWQSITAGWKFIWNSQVLLSVMALDMFAVLFGGATAMLPVYADQVLHVGAEGLGALRAAPAAGTLIMTLWLAVMPPRYLSAKRLIMVVAGFGLCIIGFGLSKLFWLSLLFLAISGVLDAISINIRWTMMQILTPPTMLGRVTSINSMFISSSNEIGSFESGTAARLMGLVPSVVFGGVMTVGIAIATALLAPKFRKTVVDAEASE